MNTKVYQKPTTKVVKLQHHGMLMTSGGESKATVQDYGWETETEE